MASKRQIALYHWQNLEACNSALASLIIKHPAASICDFRLTYCNLYALMCPISGIFTVKLNQKQKRELVKLCVKETLNLMDRIFACWDCARDHAINIKQLILFGEIEL